MHRTQRDHLEKQNTIPCFGNPDMNSRVAFVLALAPLSAGC